jgi:hypothetical protein
MENQTGDGGMFGSCSGSAVGYRRWALLRERGQWLALAILAIAISSSDVAAVDDEEARAGIYDCTPQLLQKHKGAMTTSDIAIVGKLDILRTALDQPK